MMTVGLKMLTLAALLVLLGGIAQADDKKASASGTWKWTRKGQDGQEHESKLKLKQDGEKLTGTLTRDSNDLEIKDGKVKDGEISFRITFERDGNEVNVKFQGKLEGDKIKGKVEVGERSFDWEPTRVKEDKK